MRYQTDYYGRVELTGSHDVRVSLTKTPVVSRKVNYGKSVLRGLLGSVSHFIAFDQTNEFKKALGQATMKSYTSLF